MKDTYYEDEDCTFNFMDFFDEELEEEEEETVRMIEQASNKKYIAVLEYKEKRIRNMEHSLFFFIDDESLIFFDNAKKMVEWLRHNISNVVFISLDYDVVDALGAFGNGGMVVNYLLGIEPTCPVLIHTADINAGMMMETWLNAHGWDVKRIDFRNKHAYDEWEDKASEIIKQYKSKMVSM